MKEIESEEQHRVWFCVIQYILTSINVCSRSVLMKEIESEEQHRKGVVLCHTNTTHTDIN